MVGITGVWIFILLMVHQKVLQINNELTDMENCEILTLAWADKSIYYREHHFPDPIVLRAEYF